MFVMIEAFFWGGGGFGGWFRTRGFGLDGLGETENGKGDPGIRGQGK
jgi:hypothetical protein